MAERQTHRQASKKKEDKNVPAQKVGLPFFGRVFGKELAPVFENARKQTTQKKKRETHFFFNQHPSTHTQLISRPIAFLSLPLVFFSCSYARLDSPSPNQKREKRAP
nr:hypothetical protein [Pandoravirus aubagnensis]